jgi:hypothetical protein
VVKVFPESLSLKLGANGEFTCLVENDVFTSKLKWLKGETKLANNNKYVIEKNTLKILNVQSGDAGKYTCRVISETKELSKTVNLKLIG